jgi:hypothetical protein
VVVGDGDALDVGDSDGVGVGCAVAAAIEHTSIIAVAVANLIMMSPVKSWLEPVRRNRCLEHQVPLVDAGAMTGEHTRCDHPLSLAWQELKKDGPLDADRARMKLAID